MVAEVKQENNYVLLIVIIAAILFFVVVLPMIEAKNSKENLTNVGSNDQIVKIDQNLCSRQCCKQTQWPLPEELKTKDIPEEKLSNYVGSNFSCNYGNGSGCLCVSKENINYLSNRGNNAGSNMCSM